jgi:predicted transcriptional regulator
VTAVDWESVARGTLHPLQVAILERAAASPDEKVSPIELAQELGVPLGNASYHVRVLHTQGFLVKAGTRARRGAVQHYYRAASALLA